MVQRFGSREICDVTFKALTDMMVGNRRFKAGQPVFVIDTAQTSNMEQATTVVYAQGGRGYNRLIAWEGEKTMTFNVTDALMSPMGLAVLTDAGLIDASANNAVHVHVTFDTVVGAGGVAKVSYDELCDELGLVADATITPSVDICADDNIKVYATVLDHNGSIVDWIDTVTLSGVNSTSKVASVTPSTDASFTVASTYVNKTIKLDFYVVMKSNATQITIEPSSFGGYFYVEADTLYRNEDGKDMAATLTYPKVKINSAFTITMAANGDPSTFDFQMDAMPGYTYFNRKKKAVCDIAIIGQSSGEADSVFHTEEAINHPGE